MGALLEVKGLRKEFAAGGRKKLTAINGIDLQICPGETFGLIGESGSGKSTVGRCVLDLLKPTDGKIRYKGEDLIHCDLHKKKKLRREMQMVFQDPYYSLNPRSTTWDTVYETLRVDKCIGQRELSERVREVLGSVCIKEEEYGKYPHQLSAGQQQRVGIARAIVARPNFIVLDEPTSSLDVSIRSEIIGLLGELQKEMGVAYLFISHDLSTIKYLCHRVAVMYLGSIVEYGSVPQIFEGHSHPYSKALLASVMVADPKVERSSYKLAGEIPSPIDLPPGCPLASRCPEATEVCRKKEPDMIQVEKGHFVKCHKASGWMLGEDGEEKSL